MNKKDIKAVVFGAGKYGKTLTQGLQKYYGVAVVAVCDNNEAKVGGAINDIPIISPGQLHEYDYDKIFICIRRGNLFRAVEAQLMEMGISKEKIVIMQRSAEYQDAFLEFDFYRKNWIKYFADYTREIGLKGSVAECGVYYGETACSLTGTGKTEYCISVIPLKGLWMRMLWKKKKSLMPLKLVHSRIPVLRRKLLN